jgi:hypothetical protein
VVVRYEYNKEPVIVSYAKIASFHILPKFFTAWMFDVAPTCTKCQLLESAGNKPHVTAEFGKISVLLELLSHGLRSVYQTGVE